MNYPGFEFSRQCMKLDLDDYAVDTNTSESKHVFTFQESECGSFTATTMVSISQEKWHEFVAEDKPDGLVSDFNSAMKKIAEPIHKHPVIELVPS